MNASLQSWAGVAIAGRVDAAGDALVKYCRKPKSAKRLHRARKALARLRAVLGDLGSIVGSDEAFYERVHRLHRLTGKVRDADVLLDRLARFAKSARSRQEERELAHLRAALKRRRRKARTTLRAFLSEMPELQR